MRALLCAALLVALTGCGASVVVPAPALVPVVITPEPTEVRIPALGIRSGLTALGLKADGSLEVPPVTQPGQAGWYAEGVRPGAVGPSVVVGHVSGRPPGAARSVPGVFAKLAQLKPGDEVDIGRADGTTAIFIVRSQILASKADFPAEAVYGDTAGPELRIVTCGGTYNSRAHSYDDNVIVFGDLKEVR